MPAPFIWTDLNNNPVGTASSPLSTTKSASPTATNSYQQITNVAASTPLTPPVDATMALVIPSGQAVRWRADGVAPTATVGMPLPAGSSLILYGAEIAAARFIQQTASATLDVYYSR